MSGAARKKFRRQLLNQLEAITSQVGTLKGVVEVIPITKLDDDQAEAIRAELKKKIVEEQPVEVISRFKDCHY